MYLKTLILSSAAIFITGAGLTATFNSSEVLSAQSTSEKKHSHNHHAAYVKPGAAVAMTHDYDGATAPGEFETVTLTLSHMYDDGHLRIEILPTTDLQVFSTLPTQATPLYHGSTLSLPLQVTGVKNGTYSVAIETIYESSNGQQSRRVLSLPIFIGTNGKESKSQRANSQTSKSTVKGYIALPASENIR